MKELKRIVKDLFHLLSKEDNPEEASDSVLAHKAFQVRKIVAKSTQKLTTSKCKCF